MKLTKCPNGHFYDAEKFAACPHCNRMVKAPQENAPTSPMGPGFGGNGGAGDYTVPIYPGSGSPSGVDPTIPLQPEPPRPEEKQGDDDKTIGFLSWNAPGAQGTADPGNVFRNQGTGSQKRQTSPVVGWLVCVGGASYGRSFNLYAGQNFIGRSKEMDICLSDPTVARNRHAIIIYEPIHRQFYAQAGESHELFYVNDAVVLTSTLLKDRDKIAIGSAEFVFVPFCDERYGWIDRKSDSSDRK